MMSEGMVTRRRHAMQQTAAWPFPRDPPGRRSALLACSLVSVHHAPFFAPLQQAAGHDSCFTASTRAQQADTTLALIF